MLLIGNGFPLSLIRQPVHIEPMELAVLQERILTGEKVASFWGHPNTIAVASGVLGTDLTPAIERPVLQLSENWKPYYQEQEFEVCWILSPQYRQNVRPGIKEEMTPDDILSWQLLKISWESE